MRLRETPETDAEIRIHTLFSIGEEQYLVRADFARKLERERDEAREGQMEALCDFQLLARKIDDIRDVFDHQDEDWTGSTPLADAVSKVIRERDEAREDTPWHANGETKDEWFARQREKCAAIERERDEARAVAENLVEYAHECLVQLESWGKGYAKYEQKMETIREAIAGCEKWKEAAK